ncbi:hypothetical protein B005_0413 [Nocardiopsis alba ATCC BAA-2165]|uniref:Uncharacterized protein n=1 Tax=Nocardiopsis alba (strain ATCC BAA-2165 / BE74) TaxID=1205910 RepID=J7L682_NOCAA|nr:hypothetical protein B005_0413 [Nocardiopsis alba ATCC BAA-2165]
MKTRSRLVVAHGDIKQAFEGRGDMTGPFRWTFSGPLDRAFARLRPRVFGQCRKRLSGGRSEGGMGFVSWKSVEGPNGPERPAS